MKKLMFLIIFIAAFLNIYATEDGFSLYLKKDYKGAYSSFKKEFVESKGDPLYSYNLGVTSNAMGKKGTAVYFYVQALQRSPEFSEAKNNLEILSKELNVTIPKALTEPIHAVDYILIIFLVSTYIFSILLSVLCFYPDWRIKTALLPVFLIMAVSAVMYFMKYEEESRVSWGVVVTAEQLKSGPDESLSDIGKLKEGEIINIVSSSGSWYKVKSFQDNVEGWVKLGSVRAVMRGHI